MASDVFTWAWLVLLWAGLTPSRFLGGDFHVEGRGFSAVGGASWAGSWGRARLLPGPRCPVTSVSFSRGFPRFPPPWPLGTMRLEMAAGRRGP